MTSQSLSHIRVLDLSRVLAGPWCTQNLADLGAEVIKIENRDQGGDATRSMGPFFLGEHDSQFFQAFNLNKKSVTLNLKHAAGREAFHKLLRTADVVLNNLRGDQPDNAPIRAAQANVVWPALWVGPPPHTPPGKPAPERTPKQERNVS